MRQSRVDAAIVLEIMSESVVITDTQLEKPGPLIVYVNPAFEQMTGWSRDEIIGKSPRVLQGPKTDLNIFKDLREKLYRGESWYGRTINYRKNGSEFFMEWSITPVPDQKGNIHQYIAVQRDVTQIVITEIQLEKAREMEKEQLLEIHKTNQELSKLVSEQERTLSLFMKYVPESIVKKSLYEEKTDFIKGERLDAALLFCDIRGFTAIADLLNPDQVVHLLNLYYSRMSEVIDKYEGVINEFVGDEIFVAFGVPLPIAQPELSAVRCSLAMIEGLKGLNEEIREELNTEIVIGIGINYGSVIAGNLGSEHKLKYSITGSPVITAKRIESLTKELPNSVLVSQPIFDKVREHFKTKSWGMVNIKGRDDKIKVYQVLEN